MFAMYNYKGGVGKSTLTINLAATFANLGYKTLIIDCDPQCNTTTFFLPDTVKPKKKALDVAGKEESDSGPPVPRMRFTTAATASSVFTEELCRPVPMGGEFMVIDYDKLLSGEESPFGPAVGDVFKLLESIIEPDPHKEFSLPQTFKTEEPNLWLLPGSDRLSEFEGKFSSVMGSASSMTRKESARCIGALRYAVNGLCERDKYEVVLLDFSPNSGVINKSLIMACDFIIPPCFADYFSLSSVHGLLYNVIPSWLEWRNKAVAYQAILNASDLLDKYRLPKEPPKLLPFLIGNFTMTSFNAPPQVQYVIQGEAVFVRALKDLLMKPSVPEQSLAIFADSRERMALTFLRNMGAINDVAHYIGVPVVNITASLLTDKKRWGADQREANGLMNSGNRTQTRFNALAACMRSWCHMAAPRSSTSAAGGGGGGGGKKRALDDDDDDSSDGAAPAPPAKKPHNHGGGSGNADNAR